MARIYLFLLIAVILVLNVTGQHNTQYLEPAGNQCKWVLKLTTGSAVNAATNATISIKILVDLPVLGQHYVAQTIGNLNRYNRRQGDPNVPRNYLPFRRNQADFFEFQGPCSSSACTITFENSGTGTEPAWQLASAQASITRPGLPVRELNANVNNWVAQNLPPYNAELSVNFCTGAVTTAATKPANHLN